jgi:hypothetical protein
MYDEGHNKLTEISSPSAVRTSISDGNLVVRQDEAVTRTVSVTKNPPQIRVSFIQRKTSQGADAEVPPCLYCPQSEKK